MADSDLNDRLGRRTALLIIDMQNDYCVPGGVTDIMGGDVSGSPALAGRLSAFVDRARERVDLTVFVRTEITPWTRSAALAEQYGRSGLKRTIRPDLSDWFGVAPTARDAILTKQRYSAFVDTPLPAMLRAARIESLILTGVTTEICVESTARDAFMRDYSVTVVSDCTQGATAERHDQALQRMDLYFARVASADAVLAALAARPGNKN